MIFLNFEFDCIVKVICLKLINVFFFFLIFWYVFFLWLYCGGVDDVVGLVLVVDLKNIVGWCFL